MALIKCIGAAVLCTATSFGSAVSQSSAPHTRADHYEYVLHVEPIAVGVRYGLALGHGWRIGPQLIIGPFHAVSLHRPSTDPLTELLTAYAVISWRWRQRAALVLAPVGLTLGAGSDSGELWPTGRLGLEYRLGRALVGSDLLVIRILGSSGTGQYWTQWIPLRVGIDLGEPSSK